MKLLRNIKTAINEQMASLESVKERISSLTRADFPKVVLDKHSALPKIYLARYFFDDNIKKDGLNFIRVAVTGENYSKTYEYDDFKLKYVEYSHKYVQLNYPDDEE